MAEKDKKKLVVILDNLRSAFNVGAIFRTADAVGAEKIYLCGITPTPSNDKITKVALGAEKTVPWIKIKDTWRVLEQLKKEGYYLIALEQTEYSQNIFKSKARYPLALILGSETKGLSPRLLKRADKVVEIPMKGKKESLNVAISFAVAAYIYYMKHET